MNSLLQGRVNLGSFVGGGGDDPKARSGSDAADLSVAASGYGHSGYGHETYCPEGVPVEAALLAILGAFGAAFGVLYTAITMITAAKRKKRSSDSDYSDVIEAEDMLSDTVWLGRIQNKLPYSLITTNGCSISFRLKIT